MYGPRDDGVDSVTLRFNAYAALRVIMQRGAHL